MSRTQTTRRFLPALAAALGVLLIAVPAASAGVFSPQNDGSPNAESITTLYRLVAILGLIVFLLVEGALFYSLFKYRAKKGASAAQIHGNTRLEVGWTVAAALILVLITVVTFIELPNIKNPARSDIDANGNPVASNVAFASTDQPRPPKGATLNIKVDGQQYVWRYQYPGDKPVFAYEEMVVPVGMTVTLDISADDVAHSWWIPSLGGKMDAVPGYVNQAWFKASKPGNYVGQCAELCGRGHANMVARVRAVPFEEYQEWYDQQATDIEQARKLAAEQRKQLTGEEGEQAAQGGGAAGGATSDEEE
jgi:cytochrome c oxidase subunit 2